MEPSTPGGRRLPLLPLTLVVLLLSVAGVVAAWGWLRPSPADRLEVYGTVPDFALVERDGRTITKADLLGHVTVVDFFYTRCPDTCPLQSAYFERVQEALPRVLLVSITVDPDHDDRDVLTAYAARFHADPHRWLFLTGARNDVYRLAVDGFHLAALVSRATEKTAPWAWLAPARAWAHGDEEGAKVIRLVHASRLALVDRQARIRGYVDATEPGAVKQVEAAVARLLAER